MAVDGSLIFDTKVDTKEFSRDTKSIKLMLDSLKSGFGKLDVGKAGENSAQSLKKDKRSDKHFNLEIHDYTGK